MMPVVEWDDLIAFGWAIVFLIWAHRFRSPDNRIVKAVAQADGVDPEKLGRKWSRLCMVTALCLVVVGIAAIMDWTAVALTVFFGMAASLLFSKLRAWWKDAEQKAQQQDH